MTLPSPRDPLFALRTSLSTAWGHRPSLVDNSRSSTERHRCDLAAGDRLWTARRGLESPLRCGDDGLSPIHRPYYDYYFFGNTNDGKGPTVKFRCERDVLAEPWPPRDVPRRAAPARSPCSGSASVGAWRRARRHRHRPRADDPADDDRRWRDATALSSCRPGSAPTSCVVAGRARWSSSSGDDEATITAGRSQFSLRSYDSTTSRPRSTRRPRRSRCRRAAFADALRQVVRAASTDDARAVPHRRAHGRRGRRPAPGRHRLVPAGGARPARDRRSSPRARRCWCRTGRSTELAAHRRLERRAHGAPRRA